MKSLIGLLLFAFLLIGCSVTNRIIVTDHEGEGLKHMWLVQSPELRAEGAEKGPPGSSCKGVTILYLFEEKTAVRPQVTLETDLSAAIIAKIADGEMVMVLDREDIPLSLYGRGTDSLQGSSDLSARENLKQKYLIPENLWLSIVHSKEISYRILGGEEGSVHLYLNQKQKDKLSEFMKMAIRQRDMRFPSVPEGQVKW
ncbi:MAG TPA: hypothetical protein VFG54_20710 [Prolixibacteraceae bacterium]|nr:hypothetical protein [Prolixibacteraceae bacterium]